MTDEQLRQELQARAPRHPDKRAEIVVDAVKVGSHETHITITRKEFDGRSATMTFTGRRTTNGWSVFGNVSSTLFATEYQWTLKILRAMREALNELLPAS